ncbi:hypothetical protein AUK40_02555 [Candidatus Wirthbacteria bacterium CG2_30_54_11]|uniref:Inositol-1-monophosphatase n=1 Tax=Candidatus Wirthbacteria bacterium CG2_30_54_11 TaxID=1817892 RepID=A0A1J5IXB0_9BACT|nr:MAG: hypothetical protein AUK40_02555 [Candidatus Wirthbacteria bacterium CG2_30_54_11]
MALNAGDILMSYFGNSPKTTLKKKNDVVTEADLKVEKILAGRIRKAFPEHKILSEETVKDTFGPDDMVWVIDPLDGTNNFSVGLPTFCTSIALWQGDTALIGAIYTPVYRDLYLAERGLGAYKNGHPLQVRTNEHERLTLLAELPLSTLETGQETHRSLYELLPHISHYRLLGSAATDLALVASLPGCLSYVTHCKAWDLAAGSLIASEAGARVTDLDGNAVTLRSTNFLAAHPLLHAHIFPLTKAHA